MANQEEIIMRIAFSIYNMWYLDGYLKTNAVISSTPPIVHRGKGWGWWPLDRYDFIIRRGRVLKARP